MDKKTLLIICIVIIVWGILFAIFMAFGKKRVADAKDFYVKNKDKALLHIYGKHIQVDGKNLSIFPHITGENLQQIIAEYSPLPSEGCNRS